jgi:hypothetical protein
VTSNVARSRLHESVNASGRATSMLESMTVLRALLLLLPFALQLGTADHRAGVSFASLAATGGDATCSDATCGDATIGCSGAGSSRQGSRVST